MQFDQAYARWVSENLHRLNPDSIRFLTDLGSKSKYHVQLSLVTDLSEGSALQFDQLTKVCEGRGMPLDKYTLLEKAIEHTNNFHIKLSVTQLKTLIMFVLKTNISAKAMRDRLKETTLDKWIESAQQ